MAKQMLFYEQVAPLSAERHRDWSVDRGKDYSFAAEINSCPLMASEFLAASVDLPIIFGRNDKTAWPMAVLGFEPGKSLLVDKKGQWKGGYVPAFIRRYPFVFAQAQADAPEKLMLCIDEDHKGCDPEGKRGQRLFGDDGKPTDFLKNALEFARTYELEHRRSQAFVSLLTQHALLDPMNAQVTMPDGSKRALTGFQMVSREKLKALPDDVVKQLFDNDALELIYAHLGSVRNLERLRELT